jgi:hypothetical protein
MRRGRAVGVMGDPRSWVDRLVGAALGLLAAAIATNLAVALTRPLLPCLIVLLAMLAVFAILVRGR